MWETSTNYQTYQTQTTGFDGEGQITSAITYVTSENNPKVYWVTGHGEASESDLSTVMPLTKTMWKLVILP